jgi:hypothetical protein
VDLLLIASIAGGMVYLCVKGVRGVEKRWHWPWSIVSLFLTPWNVSPRQLYLHWPNDHDVTDED